MQTTHIARPIGVSAAQISGIQSITEGVMLALVGQDVEHFANHAMLARYTPVPGDYLVTQDDGYTYVNPKDVFERKYAKVTGDVAGGPNPDYVPPTGEGQSFCFALEWLKVGKPVTRAGWNGKGMFVYLVPANSYPAQTGVAKAFFGDGALVPYNAYLALKGVDGSVNTWVPSISDLLAHDWQLATL